MIGSIFANTVCWETGGWSWAHIIIIILAFLVFSYLLNQTRDIFTTSVHSSCYNLLPPSSLNLFLCEMITETVFSFFILGFLSFSPCAVGNQSVWLLISVNTISQEDWASQSEPPGADWAANGSKENWVPLDTLTCCMSVRVAMETLLYREAQWKHSGLRE